MSADEIVKGLRAEAQFQKDRFSRFLLADAMSNAADLIESLQAQLSTTQRKERAAVECVEEVEYSLANSRFSAAWAAIRKWRGIQEAEKGENNA